MTRFTLLALVAAVVAAIFIAFFLLDPDCSDRSKEPVGAQHPVECK